MDIDSLVSEKDYCKQKYREAKIKLAIAEILKTFQPQVPEPPYDDKVFLGIPAAKGTAEGISIELQPNPVCVAAGMGINFFPETADAKFKISCDYLNDKYNFSNYVVANLKLKTPRWLIIPDRIKQMFLEKIHSQCERCYEIDDSNQVEFRFTWPVHVVVPN